MDDGVGGAVPAVDGVPIADVLSQSEELVVALQCAPLCVAIGGSDARGMDAACRTALDDYPVYIVVDNRKKR